MKSNNKFGWLIYGLAAITIAPAWAQSETVLHNFGSPPKGAGGPTTLVRDSAGNFYGVTPQGGSANQGVVFKLTPGGRQTVLCSFTGGTDGASPNGIIRDAAGSIYGTTLLGGTNNAGTLFMLDTSGHKTVLHHFTGGADGGSPNNGLVRDSDGSLYGTAQDGGIEFNGGVVFKLDSSGSLTVLYTFVPGLDGCTPKSGLIRDSDGNFYGTTSSCGSVGSGVVYKLDTGGQETVLYNFTGGADGSSPYSGVIRDSSGNFYGTTVVGGAHGFGVVYKVDSSGQETVLYSFNGGAGGGWPYTGVVRDAAGHLYGVNTIGGSATAFDGHGVAYRLDPGGHETVLHTFSGGVDGGSPSDLILSGGKLYGGTTSGGAGGYGVVFQLESAGETVLYNFPSPADGTYPQTALTTDSAGNFYGTTSAGGSPYNLGTIYKLDAGGNYTLLHTFNGAAGADPTGSIALDSAGNLYGTTYSGGSANLGVAYKLDTAGNFTMLHTFTGGADGANPGGIVRDPAGNLYGGAYNGGAPNYGVVFKIDSSGQETLLYTFSGGTDGGHAYGGLALDTSGNLYGTTGRAPGSHEGVIYKLDPSGHETVLHAFGMNECCTYGVIRDAAGNLYGADTNGFNEEGFVYKLDASGHFGYLVDFGGEGIGIYPNSLILDSAGNLYGTTSEGGIGSCGIVFKIGATTSIATVLYNFSGDDGCGSQAGLVFDSAGNLYGTTYSGGTVNTGVVFKLNGPF